MNNGERFARLFKGYTARYGRYDIEGASGPETKVAGKAKTVDREVTLQDYSDHIAGKVGIGIIPLQGDPKTPGFVNFAAIDIDVYKAETQAAKNLTHGDVALTLLETPLIVTKSKSGGIHVWLFSKDGVSAKLATAYLQMQAALLGVAGTEVFPKQNERNSDEDVGNWINLPFFGDARQAVIPHKSGSVVEFRDTPLDQFLDIAEAASADVTDAWLEAHTQTPPSQRGKDFAPAPENLFLDGPPCLEALLRGFPERVAAIQKRFERGEITADQRDKQITFTAPQLSEGSRDHTFLNVGHYLRRRINSHDPEAPIPGDAVPLLEALKEAHDVWGLGRFGKAEWEKPRGKDIHGISSDLPRIAKQAAKGKWGYSCTKEPLKGFCDRRKCLKRKFGIGTTTSDATMPITGFTIVNTADKQYYMNLGEHRIHVPDVATLLSQHDFAKIVTNETNRIWPMMQDAKYKEMMDALLKNAVDKGDVIEGPPDSDRNSIVLDALAEFVDKRKIDAGKSDAAFFSGRVIWADNNLTAMFKFDQFMAYLAAKGLRYSSNQIAHMLVNEFDVEARGNTHIANRQARPYVVTLARLNELMGKD